MSRLRLSPYTYASKRINRILNKAEKALIMTLFIEDRMSPKEIQVLMNLNEAKVHEVLFKDVKPFKNFFNRGVCAFGKKTAYWETEEELIESFDPQYEPGELVGDELIIFKFSKGEIKIKTVLSKFR